MGQRWFLWIVSSKGQRWRSWCNNISILLKLDCRWLAKHRRLSAFAATAAKLDLGPGRMVASRLACYAHGSGPPSQRSAITKALTLTLGPLQWWAAHLHDGLRAWRQACSVTLYRHRNTVLAIPPSSWVSSLSEIYRNDNAVNCRDRRWREQTSVWMKILRQRHHSSHRPHVMRVHWTYVPMWRIRAVTLCGH